MTNTLTPPNHKPLSSFIFFDYHQRQFSKAGWEEASWMPQFSNCQGRQRRSAVFFMTSAWFCKTKSRGFRALSQRRTNLSPASKRLWQDVGFWDYNQHKNSFEQDLDKQKFEIAESQKQLFKMHNAFNSNVCDALDARAAATQSKHWLKRC
jgi:hypothetical protein